MAEKQRPGIAYVVSLCGIMCGLSEFWIVLPLYCCQ